MAEEMEYIAPKRESDIESSWKAFEKSHEFSDPLKYTTSQLEHIVQFWIKEKANPLRTDRAKEMEIEPVIQRGVYEIYCRNREDRMTAVHRAVGNITFKGIMEQ